MCPDFLNIRIHMSRGWSKEDAEKIIMQDTDDGDLVVQDNQGRGLQSKLNFGRPNWAAEFEAMTRKHAGSDIGVFFCGPKVLSSELHRRCNEFTNNKTHKVGMRLCVFLRVCTLPMIARVLLFVFLRTATNEYYVCVAPRTCPCHPPSPPTRLDSSTTVRSRKVTACFIECDLHTPVLYDTHCAHKPKATTDLLRSALLRSALLWLQRKIFKH